MNVSTSFRKYGLIWLLPALLLAGFFVWLGLWQLDRAAQKRAILQQIDSAEALALDAVSADSANYSTVQGRGSYLPYALLLDNQVLAGRQGVHVLSPLLLEDNRLLLVNRGWLPMAVDRRELPAVKTPQQPVTISGRLAPLPGVGLRLGAQPPLDLQQWPQLITYVDAQLLQRGFRKLVENASLELLPQVLKLDAEARAWFRRTRLATDQLWSQKTSGLCTAVVYAGGDGTGDFCDFVAAPGQTPATGSSHA